MKKIRLLILTILLTTAVPNKVQASEKLLHLGYGLTFLLIGADGLKIGIRNKNERLWALLGLALIGSGVYNLAQLKNSK